MTSSVKDLTEFNGFQKFVRFVIFRLVHLFYPRIAVDGLENLPTSKSAIFVLNHPNGLLDPLLLMIALNRQISFWAKSTLFGNPFGKFFCESFGALPIYRKRDEGQPGGPTGDAKERNEVIFARSRELLHQGGAMALFPEGKSHSESHLLELRTGAARIALSTEAEAGWQGNMPIVPVGLWYENKSLFRTSVLLVIGQSFTLEEYAEAYALEEVQTVRTVTRRIRAGLEDVVLEAENSELLAVIPVLAAWTSPTDKRLKLPEHHEWTTKLVDTYHYLRKHNPLHLERIAQQARDYASTLQTLGISDPWTLELPIIKPWMLLYRILWLIVMLPFAIAGFILSFGPYRLARPIATKLTGQYTDLLGTFKLISGAILVFAGWLVEAIVVGVWLGIGWGLGLLVVAPLLGYIALRWGERWRRFKQLLASGWIRFRRQDLTKNLTQQRHNLSEQVFEAVQMASAG